MKKGDAVKAHKEIKGFFPRVGRFFANLWRTLIRTAKEDLNNPDVFRRMGAAAIWVFLFFAVSWLISYFLLKPDALTRTWLVDKIFGIKAAKGLIPKEGVTKDPLYWPRVLFVAGKIFLHYLVVMVIFVFILNHFRVGRLNLGYVFLFAYAALIGGVVGTNSFPYYARTRIAALITFARFSLWQLLAFLLAVVSTTGLGTLATPGWLRSSWEKIKPWRKLNIRGEDLEVLIYALLILLASSIAEARLIDFYKLYT